MGPRQVGWVRRTRAKYEGGVPPKTPFPMLRIGTVSSGRTSQHQGARLIVKNRQWGRPWALASRAVIEDTLRDWGVIAMGRIPEASFTSAKQSKHFSTKPHYSLIQEGPLPHTHHANGPQGNKSSHTYYVSCTVGPCAMYYVLYIMYNVLCIRCYVSCIMYRVICIMCQVLCIMYYVLVHSTWYIIHST